MSRKHTINVAVSLGQGIMVRAKGQPAQVVGVAAAIGVAVMASAVAYGAYASIASAVKRRRALSARNTHKALSRSPAA